MVHRNLEYLRTAKRVNARQAQCSLFSRINFTLTCRPGEKNLKSGALSRSFKEKKVTEEKTVLPTELTIGSS